MRFDADQDDRSGHLVESSQFWATVADVGIGPATDVRQAALDDSSSK
jgi:hypothetical protein